MMRWHCTLAVVVWIGLFALPPPASPEATEKKAYAEIEADKALLYVIRPKGARGGNVVALDVFADAKFLVRLRGNSYGFAHLDPGIHTIWGSNCYREMEFVPGEVFFLLCGDLGMATLTEEEGRAYLEQIRYYNPPDPEVEANRSKKEAKAAKNLPKVRRSWEKRLGSIDLEPLPSPVAPTDTTGRLRVSAYSPIELELMENISSFMSQLGEDVWFRVREDVRLEGKIWLPAGTPVRGRIVEIHGARRHGGSGGFEIAIPSVETPDGTEVPLIGQFIDAGRHKLGKASSAAAAGGFLAGALVKGREAFELCGEPWKVWTRAEVWIQPTEGAGSSEQIAPELDSPHEVNFRLQGDLAFNLEKHEDATDITIIIETEQSISNLELHAVGDWSVPEPPSALRFESRASATAVTFDGWSLLRHLRPGLEPVPVRFAGKLDDGEDLDAVGEIAWIESSPKQ